MVANFAFLGGWGKIYSVAGDYPFTPLGLQGNALHQQVSAQLREHTEQLDFALKQQRDCQVAVDDAAAQLEAAGLAERARLSGSGATAAALVISSEWGARARGRLLVERHRAERADTTVRRSEGAVAEACSALQNSAERLRALVDHRSAWQCAQDRITECAEEEAALESKGTGAKQ